MNVCNVIGWVRALYDKYGTWEYLHFVNISDIHIITNTNHISSHYFGYKLIIHKCMLIIFFSVSKVHHFAPICFLHIDTGWLCQIGTFLWQASSTLVGVTGQSSWMKSVRPMSFLAASMADLIALCTVTASSRGGSPIPCEIHQMI